MVDRWGRFFRSPCQELERRGRFFRSPCKRPDPFALFGPAVRWSSYPDPPPLVELVETSCGCVLAGRVWLPRSGLHPVPPKGAARPALAVRLRFPAGDERRLTPDPPGRGAAHSALSVASLPGRCWSSVLVTRWSSLSRPCRLPVGRACWPPVGRACRDPAGPPVGRACRITVGRACRDPERPIDDFTPRLFT